MIDRGVHRRAPILDGNGDAFESPFHEGDCLRAFCKPDKSWYPVHFVSWKGRVRQPKVMWADGTVQLLEVDEVRLCTNEEFQSDDYATNLVRKARKRARDEGLSEPPFELLPIPKSKRLAGCKYQDLVLHTPPPKPKQSEKPMQHNASLEKKQPVKAKVSVEEPRVEKKPALKAKVPSQDKEGAGTEQSHVPNSTLTAAERVFLKAAKVVRTTLKLQEMGADKLDKCQKQKVEKMPEALKALAAAKKDLPEESDLLSKNKDLIPLMIMMGYGH